MSRKHFPLRMPTDCWRFIMRAPSLASNWASLHQLPQSILFAFLRVSFCVELLLFFKEKAKQSFCFSCFKSKIWKATFQRRSLRFWLCCKKNEENSFVMEKAPGQAESKQFPWKEIKAVWKCFPLSVLKGDRKFHGNNILQHFGKEHIYKYFL